MLIKKSIISLRNSLIPSREFFEVYPEMKISTFQYAGAQAVKMENKALYKLLVRLFGAYKKGINSGSSKKVSLEKAFRKYEDHIKIRMEEIKTTEIIATSLKAKKLINYIQQDALTETFYKMERTKRDIGFDEIKDEVDAIYDFEGSVSPSTDDNFKDKTC